MQILTPTKEKWNLWFHADVNDSNSQWTRGLAKQPCSLLNVISRDDFLNDNDSSNESQKGSSH